MRFSATIDDSMAKLFIANEAIQSTKRDYGGGILLYPAEIHILSAINEHKDWNTSTLAENFSVTKGAASKWITKLEKKGLVFRYNAKGNKKDVYFGLTELGTEVCSGHEAFHEKLLSEISEQLDGYSEREQEIILSFIKIYTQEISKYRQQGVE